MRDHILLSTDTIAELSDELKAELAARLGFTLASPAPPQAFGDEEIAELGIQSARAFLQGCSDRTAEVLRLIIEFGDTFSLRQLEKKAKVKPGGLRGVWTGLTKRTRTITGDPDAVLIDWSGPDEEGDYQGRLARMTIDALRRALAED
ncbi:MAG TPA: hypothetical protein VF548_05130 [Allosphingosinicella sp.]|jgi:hypothetical protein